MSKLTAPAQINTTPSIYRSSWPLKINGADQLTSAQAGLDPPAPYIETNQSKSGAVGGQKKYIYQTNQPTLDPVTQPPLSGTNEERAKNLADEGTMDETDCLPDLPEDKWAWSGRYLIEWGASLALLS